MHQYVRWEKSWKSEKLSIEKLVFVQIKQTYFAYEREEYIPQKTCYDSNAYNIIMRTYFAEKDAEGLQNEIHL